MVKPSPHRASIIRLHNQGLSAKYICKNLKVGISLVYGTIKRYSELGNESDRLGRGRPSSVITLATIKKRRDRFRFKANRSVRGLAIQMNI